MNEMMSKLNAIYMTLCAAVVLAGVAVHASHAPGETSLTGLDEHAVISVIEAVGSAR